MTIERRYSGVEVRAIGRTLSGPALVYGDTSPTHRERFEPGAFVLDGTTRWLDVDHIGIRAGDARLPSVIAYTGGGGLLLTDTATALEVRADLPEIPSADMALEGVATRRYRGFSVEFRPREESRAADGIRVIQRADLVGIGLVGEPSFSQSKVEIRQRSGRTMRARIPSGVPADCNCLGGECAKVEFDREVLERMWDETGEAVAGLGSYSDSPLASISSGTLRGRMVGDGLELDIDMPTGAVGDATLAAHEAAGVIVRPHLDRNLSDFTIQEGVARYQRAVLRGVIVSATDKRVGWPAPVLVSTPEFPEEPPAPRNANVPWWAV